MSLASWALSQKIQELVLSGHPAWPGMLWLCPSHEEDSVAASMVCVCGGRGLGQGSWLWNLAYLVSVLRDSSF